MIVREVNPSSGSFDARRLRPHVGLAGARARRGLDLHEGADARPARPRGRYGVSVLADEQEHVSRHFAGRPEEEREVGLVEVDGIPVVKGALTHVVAGVVDAHPAGDHTLFVGEVLHFAHRPGEPLIFHSGAYRNLLAAPGDPTRSGEWTGEPHTWELQFGDSK